MKRAHSIQCTQIRSILRSALSKHKNCNGTQNQNKRMHIVVSVSIRFLWPKHMLNIAINSKQGNASITRFDFFHGISLKITVSCDSNTCNEMALGSTKPMCSAMNFNCKTIFTFPNDCMKGISAGNEEMCSILRCQNGQEFVWSNLMGFLIELNRKYW